ncbi:MAG: hypothetical protein CVV24_02510 [Ignavibacteriae bacterium HGW-Ignavibacteriae-3]|nr:MAG: hypothetical protein CVV24_02510 [Ignavibacteriae bacterium HGW-Ignavibacteriae-3]
MNYRPINHYLLLADLFVYPIEELRFKTENAQKFLDGHYPTAAKYLAEFTSIINSIPLRQWEEIYTRSFDVQALTTLDAGYVLFGDDYKRGELLVNLNNEHKKTNNDCGTELADHLPNLLRLLVRVNDDDFKNDLIFLIIIPALKKIIGEFENEKIHKKNDIYEKHHKTLITQEENNGKAYKWPLLALLEVLTSDFQENHSGMIDGTTFSHEISNELKIQS